LRAAIWLPAVDRPRARGSYAEYLTVPASEIVRKPATFTMAERLHIRLLPSRRGAI
jgi:NADPH:quinone reductase-like Zn-dependent oxidoreductase